MRKPSCYFVVLVLLVFSKGTALPQEPFYRGKTVTVIVGADPGGGLDTLARVISRHLGKHIAGNPTIVVQNMPGAASLISANHVYKIAKPDDLTIGHFSDELILAQLMGKPGIEFDARKFEHIGVPAQDSMVIGLSKATGIRTLEQWMASKRSVKLGGIGPGVGTDDVPKLVRATLGLPLQLASGYKGTAPIRLAFNSGEVEGLCNAWESFKATWRSELDAGDLIIPVQVVPKALPDLPNVPVAIDFAKTDEARKLIEVGAHSNSMIGKPFVLPPGTPKELLEALRRGFMDTVRDSQFLADAGKAKLDIKPEEGAAIQRRIEGMFGLEPSLVVKLRDILLK